MDRLVVRIGKAALVGMMAIPTIPAVASEGSKACGLLNASEIESAVGARVTLDPVPSSPGGKGDLCTGMFPDGTLMLRLATGLDSGRDRSGSKEKAGLEMMKNMGVQVEVKTFGPIVCSTLVPPAGKEQMGFNSTCTVSKDTAVAGIEITAKNKAGMVPIEKLRSLAEKMAARF